MSKVLKLTLINMLAKGNELFQKKRYKQAIKIFEKFLEYEPDWKGLNKKTGDAYRYLRDHHNSVKYYKKAFYLNPTSIEICFLLGEVYFKLGQYGDAVEYLEKVVERKSKHKAALLYLGKAYLYLNDGRNAVQSLEDLITIDRKNEIAWNFLGSAYYTLGENQKAITCIENAIKYNRKYFKAYENLAEIYHSNGQPEKALEMVNKAFQGPKDPRIWGLLGWIHYINGNLHMALENMEKAVTLSPTDYKIRINLGKIYNEEGNFFQAKINFEKAIEINPNREIAWELLANLYKSHDKFTEAVDCYRKMLEIFPSNALAWNALGELYIKTSDYSNADECFRKALEIQPDNQQFSTNLNILRIKIKINLNDLRIKIKRNLESILKFEYDHQREMTKSEMINILHFTIDELIYYLNKIDSTIEYEAENIPQLKVEVEKVIEKFNRPTLYDLLINLGYDFVAAKKIGHYMVDSGLIEEFPRVPKIKGSEPLIQKGHQEVVSEDLGDRSGGESVEPGLLVLEKGIKVSRGSSIQGAKYTFKIKVENNSKFIITNVIIQLISFPKDSLELVGARFREISKIEPSGFVSPSFEFKPTKDCIKGKLHVTVSFIDHLDMTQTVTVPVHEIELVCGLLVPKEVGLEEFSQVTRGLLDFESTGEEMPLPYNGRLIFEKLKVLLPIQNFKNVTRPESKTVGNLFIGEFKGFAEGKYSKKEVGLQITITGGVSATESVARVDGFCQDPSMLAPLMNEWAGIITEKIDASNDCAVILELAKGKHWTNIEEAMQEKKWDLQRAQTALRSLEKARIARRMESASEGLRWYFPGLKED